MIPPVPPPQFLRALFDTLSQVPKITHCQDCGSVIEPIKATLSYTETSESRYCPKCDVAKPVSTARKPESATAIAVARHRINTLVRRIRTCRSVFLSLCATY
jgi:hypothetical protein